ncbi:MAG: hypothetical protein SFU98_12130 [Leptospiraceae bacterium]|nr:hypothetical protein [Leptospiraceae bacterium]
MNLKKFFSNLIIASLVVNCSGLSIKEPFYNAPKERSLNPNWKIELLELGYYRDVNEDWWGKEFYITNFKITNKSNKYRFYNFCDKKLKKDNLIYILNRDPNAAREFDKDPSQFDTEEFYRGFPELQFWIKIDDSRKWPTSKYGNRFVFNPVKIEKDIPTFSAAMVGCHYGIPMSNDTGASSSTNGWFAPNESKTIKTVFSIPDGATFIKLFQENHYIGEIESKKVEK